MKCDTCEYQDIKKIDDFSLHFCSKGHWEINEDFDLDIVPPDLECEEKSIDIWENCIDYKKNK